MSGHSTTLAGLAAELRAGRLSSVELTQDLLARIRAAQAALNAFVTIDADGQTRLAAMNKGIVPLFFI